MLTSTKNIKVKKKKKLKLNPNIDERETPLTFLATQHNTDKIDQRYQSPNIYNIQH